MSDPAPNALADNQRDAQTAQPVRVLRADSTLDEVTLSAEDREEPTLRQFFAVLEPGDKPDERWRAFQEKLDEEARGIKWTAAMPDLGSKICDLLDVKIHHILLTAWKKADALQKALADSRQTPDKTVYLDLTEHNVDYESKPFIDVKIKSATVKKLTLTMSLNLKLKGFSLKIQNGEIRQMQTGTCEGRGTLKYENLSIVEKKFEPVRFPKTIDIPVSLPAQESAKPKLGAVVAETEAKPVIRDDLERIEL